RDFARYVWQGEDLPLIDGFGDLLGRLAAGLPIAFDSAVTQIDWHEAARVKISGPRGTLTCRRVIVTVSTGVLASNALRFRPALPPATREAIHRLPMGHCNKLALAFTRPVFGDDDPALLVPAGADAAPLELLIRPGGRELAVAVMSGDFGRALAAAGVEAARDLVLTQLVGLFGAALRQALAPAALLVNWDEAPWVRGYVAAPGPGDADARAALAMPVAERIFFAGEATSLTAMGDAHGAWRCGEAAAVAAARGLV
ncbi:MAG: FAD-dependent oxidoreductase, partial [Chloroflexi bacterium]|nr:FAD-dependent oxidoreductase [Chloroflexota bacterium]